jgi:hypothetical protein
MKLIPQLLLEETNLLLTKKSIKIKSNYIGKLNIGEGSFIRTCYSEKILKD